MTIASHIDGRMRIRDPRLQDRNLLQSLQEKLEAIGGVRRVCGNGRTGSLLILYRQAPSTTETIKGLLAALLGPETGTRPRRQRKQPSPPARAKQMRLPTLNLAATRRQAVNWGMLASLLVSLGALAVDSKRLHILAGVAFVGIFGIHLFDKRKAFVS